MSPSAMKQMSCESGFSATASPRAAASARTPALVVSPEREHRVVQLGRVSTASTYDWSLAEVDRAAQQAVRAEPGVVAGDHGVEAERERPVEDGRELDLLVAAQARVGRAAGGVLGDEVVHHAGVELVGHVPDVERDPDHVGGAAGVAGVLERAAAAGAGAVVCGLRASARCTPVTSWPASTARAAATAESTPPDMAASTLIPTGRG